MCDVRVYSALCVVVVHGRKAYVEERKSTALAIIKGETAGLEAPRKRREGE